VNQKEKTCGKNNGKINNRKISKNKNKWNEKLKKK